MRIEELVFNAKIAIALVKDAPCILGREEVFEKFEICFRQKDNVVILLFTRGKLVCTGAINEKMFYDAVEKLMQELFQKGLLVG